MSDDTKPDKLSIRVVNDGVVHPPSTLTIARKNDYGVWCESMELAADAERIFFLDKSERKTIYELRWPMRMNRKRRLAGIESSGLAGGIFTIISRRNAVISPNTTPAKVDGAEFIGTHERRGPL